MDISSAAFDPIDRERYRNLPAPLGYQNLNIPDIVKRATETEEIKINFQEWIDLGIFEDEDVSIYDHFVINSDSEDDDIIEVPVEPVVKNIESICLSDDDEENVPIPLDNIKKEKEEIKIENKTKDVVNTERIDSNRVKEVKITEQRTEKKLLAKDDEVKRKEVKSTEQKINKKPQDKAAEDVTEKRTDKYKEKASEKTEKHRDKKTKREDEEKKKREDEGSRHKKIKPKVETSDSDRSSRKKSRLPSRDNESDPEVEERYRRKEKKYRSPSPPDDYYEEDYKTDYGPFKREYDDDYMYTAASIKQEDPSVHGVYHCDICNLTLNSLVTYQSHMTGKRHKKNLDAKNVAQAVAKSYVPTKLTSKCPNPPPGFKRVESSSPATIQHVLNDKLRIPCPGLHKVTEIQSLTETSYYCTLCDAPCSANSILPHLTGFKHQLNCLKYYDLELFDEISYQQKYQIEGLVSKRLAAIENKYGRGRLKVERDVPDNGSYDRTSISSPLPVPDYSFNMPSTSSLRPPTSSRDQPSSSKQGGDFMELYQSCSVPDPSKAGFYCRICHSHSNSKAMWEAHIRGKRHLANLKKAPGIAPSKSRNVPAPPGTIPRLYSQLDGVDDPIVGLDQIREIQRLDIDSVSYTCFLCGGISVCEGEIVDHILLTKHREKYLEKIQYPELETLRNCQMSDFGLSSLIAEMCQNVEAQQGRGVPEVYYAKNSLVKL